MITGDQSSAVTRTTPVTKRSLELHRWLRRWPNFTGDQSTPVTRDHRWPNYTSDQKTTGNFAGDQASSDQTSPLTKLGEVQVTGNPPRRFLPPSKIGHCSHGGTGLYPAAAYSAAPVLRTTAATEDSSDGGDEGEAVVPQCLRDLFSQQYATCRKSCD